MVVFSDLDRSIIYSKAFLEQKTKGTYECIEIKDNREISYISLKALEFIKYINNKTTFIPTTTRTTEQFRRINFNKNNIEFEYAITCNGGCILKNNKPLDSWNEKVNKFKLEAESIDVMINIFEKYKELDGITNFRIAEDLFFYIVVDRHKFNISSLYKFIRILEDKNWIYYISGRKIYFLPKGICKENAIKYLCNLNNIKKFAVIGDSEMDRGMLDLTEKAYVLKHGDICINNKKQYFEISDSDGMKGTEEILENIIKYI